MANIRPKTLSFQKESNTYTLRGITTEEETKIANAITEHQDISGKVDKVQGKGLSSNDYTDAEKTKLAGIAEGATANTGTITGITMNGASKGTSGVVDLGTVITEHQDISGKMNSSLKGAANGVAELDSTGKVPSSQLPSYVDDVIDGYYYDNKFYEDSAHQTEIAGETGKVYVDVSTNITYRWSGSTFVPIGSDLALGETSSTAYRGDRGAAAYAAAVTDVDSTPTANSNHLVTSGGVAAAIPDVSGFYTKPSTGIPATDLEDGVIPDVSGFYTKPSTGIPATDLEDGVIPDVSGFYTKPSTGIPSTDLADGVIPDVSGFYTKPSTGIPSTDLADGVIPSVMTGATSLAAGTSGLVPTPIIGDDEKYLKGDGTWSVIQGITTLYRQFWSSTNEIEITLSTTSDKTYIVWCAGASSGANGAIADDDHGAYLIVSNQKYIIMHKGTSITVTESSGVLTISSDVNIAMAIIEL